MSLRPPHCRFVSRVSRRFLTSRALSYCAKLPAICRIATFTGRCLGHIVAVRGEYSHAAPDEHAHAELLRDQVAGEPAGILDQDDADAVTLDPIEQGTETWTGFDRVRTADGGIVEPVDEV